MDHISYHPIIQGALPAQAQVWSNHTHSAVVVWTTSSPVDEQLVQSFSERLESLVVLQALDLHQWVEDFLQAAEMGGNILHLVAFAAIKSQCVLIAYQGELILRRGGKVGSILVAEQELKVVEGSLRDDDVFILNALPDVETHQFFVKHLQDHPQQPEYLEKLLRVATLPTAAAIVQKSSDEVSADIPQDSSSFADSRVSLAGSFDSAPTSPQPAASRRSFGQQAGQMLSQLKSLGPAVFGALRGLLQSIFNAVVPFFSKDVYVRRRHTKNVVRILLPVLIIVIAASAFIFVQYTQRVEQERLAQEFLTPLTQRFTEVRALTATQPLEARKQTDELLVQIEEGVKRFENQNIAKAIVQKQLKEVQDFATSISGQQELPRLDEFYNLRFIQSDLSASKMDMNDTTMVFLDRGQRKLVALDRENKNQTLLPIGDIPDLRDVLVQGQRVYFLGDGIYRYTLGSEEAPVKLRDAEEQNSGAKFVQTFGSFVYVFHPDRQTIYRYTPSDTDSLASPAAWLRPGENIDFPNVNSFSIDGDVWTAMKNGELHKFTSGREVEFTINGLKEAFDSPVYLYTKEDFDNVYIVEPAKERVVVLTKNGEFLQEIKSGNLRTVTGITADEERKKVYGLSGPSVFELNL